MSFEHILERQAEDEYPQKTCVTKKLHNVLGLFRSIAFFETDNAVESLGRLLEKVDKFDAEEITPGCFMSHIVGQAEMITGFLTRVKKLEENKLSDTEDWKKYNREKQIVKKYIETFKDYADLCLDHEDFFRGEMKNKKGYWGDKKKKVDETEEMKEINSLNAIDYVRVSKELLKNEATEKRVQLEEAA